MEDFLVSKRKMTDKEAKKSFSKRNLSTYRVFHSEMRETKALDGHLKLNFHL
jgi:hypothetical protein